MPPDTTTAFSIPAIDLVDASRDGGVHNHTWALAGALAEAGVSVTLHCALSTDLGPPSAVRLCNCIWWGPRSAPTPVRNAAIVARFALWTAPHLAGRRRTPSVLHVQGLWKPPLFAWLMLLARTRGVAIVHSPHNTFTRDGSRLDDWLLRWMSKTAAATIVFSEPDRAIVEHRGGRPTLSRLLHFVPTPAAELVAGWRDRFLGETGGKAVLFAGQIRRDKGLVDLVDAASEWPSDWRLAVLGADAGGLAEAVSRAEQTGTSIGIWEGYASVENFAAAIAAADVVVCPYHRASQSGVLDFARRLGTPAAASAVGGLGALADRTFAPHSPSEINDVLRSLLADGSCSDRPAREPDGEAVVATHLNTYRLVVHR